MPGDAEFEITGGRIELPGGTLATVGVVGLTLVAWLVAYLSGLAPWLGYIDKTYTDVSVGGVSVPARAVSGTGFGPTTFAFLTGQEVYVDYDVTLRRGAVRIYVLEYAGMEHTLTHTVSTSGAGTAAVRIPRTGLYHISIEPSVIGGVGRGYDLDISAVWGARWP